METAKVIAKGLEHPSGLVVQCDEADGPIYVSTDKTEPVNHPGEKCRLYVSTGRVVLAYDYHGGIARPGRPSIVAGQAEEGFFTKTAKAGEPTDYCEDPVIQSEVSSLLCLSRPGGKFFEGDSAIASAISIPENGWPTDYPHDVLVAYPGSNLKSGSPGKVVRYKFEPSGRFSGQEDFITGWFGPDNKLLGSPTDLLADSKSGSYISNFYVSDGLRGAIYRVTYRPVRSRARAESASPSNRGTATSNGMEKTTPL